MLQTQCDLVGMVGKKTEEPVWMAGSAEQSTAVRIEAHGGQGTVRSVRSPVGAGVCG